MAGGGGGGGGGRRRALVLVAGALLLVNLPECALGGKGSARCATCVVVRLPLPHMPMLSTLF